MHDYPVPVTYPPWEDYVPPRHYPPWIDYPFPWNVPSWWRKRPVPRDYPPHDYPQDIHF